MSTGDEQSRVVLRILRTDRSELASVVNRLGMRGKMDLEPVVTATKAILEEVRGKGDEALLALTERFDQARLTVADLPVGEAEISMALDQVENWVGRWEETRPVDVDIDGKISLINRPLAKVGVYVPGGTAPLPSSVLMNIIPARAAGVEKIIMCTPPRADSSIDPVILAAAFIAGADEIYRIGGAQAIAAMAYGTRTIPKVDKITGPGNIYVNTAKRLVFGQVDIDMFAGPSEILIIADETADSSYVAADLLSQAEHDVLASALLVTTSEQLAEAVVSETARRAALLPRKHIIARSLNDFGAVLLVPDLATAVEFANELAPEHLELMVAEPDDLLPRIRNAGAIFVGSYSPEPLGDYFAGTNHVLPTSGTARFFSPLNTGDFIKKINLIRYTREDLAKDWRAIAEFAEAENLRAHAESVRVRFGADQLAGL